MTGPHVVVIDDTELYARGLSEWLRFEFSASISSTIQPDADLIFVGVSREPDEATLVGWDRYTAPLIGVVDASASRWLHRVLEIRPLGALLHRTAPLTVVREATASALRGYRYLDREIMPLLVAGSELRLDRYCLTARELQVLAEVVSGLANKQVAVRLGIAPSTVKQHVSAILEKTGLASRHELARLYPMNARSFW